MEVASSHWAEAIVGPPGIPSPKTLVLSDVCDASKVVEKIMARVFVAREKRKRNPGLPPLELSSEDRATFRAHTDRCRPCRQRLGYTDF